MEGALVFHQGWTDIMNCLPIVNYYYPSYNKIYLIVRDDAKQFVEFYLNDLSNVTIKYFNKDYIEPNITTILDNIQKESTTKVDKLLIGHYDKHRDDKYVNSHFITESTKKLNWLVSFYAAYDIPYINRVNCFNINRNTELENTIYNSFVKEHGNNYILYHNNYGLITHRINYLVTNDTKNKYINLDNLSQVFFDYIKVLENAKEFHVIDSMWATVIYMLDAKYGLFKDKKIYAYCRRFFPDMFINPYALPNWTIYH